MAIDSKTSPNMNSARWCANVSDDSWKLTTNQYESLLALQPVEERERIRKFLRFEDSKRSLVGRILLQNAAAMALCMQPNDVRFGRTKGKKPFIQEPEAARRGLNANVSHHGCWVVLGMEEKGLVGVDVSSNQAPRGQTFEAFFKNNTTSLISKEWDAVRSSGDTDEEKFHAFFVLWALKEAYSKATGMGIALPFRRLELSVPSHILQSFHNKVEQPTRFAGDAGITVSLDGRVKSGWEFEVYALDQNFLMAVAVGPQEMAVPSYKAAQAELLAQVSSSDHAKAHMLTVETDQMIMTGNNSPLGARPYTPTATPSMVEKTLRSLMKVQGMAAIPAAKTSKQKEPAEATPALRLDTRKTPPCSSCDATLSVVTPATMLAPSVRALCQST